MRRLSVAGSAIFLILLLLVACDGRPSHPPVLVFPTYVAGIPTLPPRGVTPTPPHPLATHLQQYDVTAVAWAPDDTLVASSSLNGTVQIWRASNGQLIDTYRVPGGATAVAWSPNGRNLAAASGVYASDTIKVWGIASGQLIWAGEGHTGQIAALAWSPDGSRLASASADETVKLWDAAGGNLLLTYAGHQAMVNAVAWSPDGARLASASNDGTVRVWDAHTGETLVIYHNHTGEVQSLAWSPDGRRIVSGGLDGTAQVWDAQSGRPLVVTKGGPEVSQPGQVLLCGLVVRCKSYCLAGGRRQYGDT